jgi:hypothetical protein
MIIYRMEYLPEDPGKHEEGKKSSKTNSRAESACNNEIYPSSHDERDPGRTGQIR